MMTSTLKKTISLMLAVLLVISMMPAIPGAVDVVHGDTTISEISVTGITAPEIGSTPDYTASVPDSASYYIGTDIAGMNVDVNGILWVNNGSSPMKQDAIFASDGSYDVRMEIYAKDGAKFDAKENLSVTINDQTAHIISRTDNMIYIRYTFGAPEVKETITSIELSHEYEIEANAYVKNLKVSKINGKPFDGEKYAGFQWYRDLANFDDISNAIAWNGSQFEGGYAYGLQVKNLPKIDGYVYHSQVLVSIKTPSKSVSSLTDQYGYAYFYWNKLDYKPALESVNIKMDGYYVGENVMSLTFKSDDPIVTTGSYGKDSGLYTIRQYNSGTGQYDVLSNTTFQANKKYYLFYRLQSDLDIYGLAPGNVKLNGKAAFSRHVEDGKQYYAFSLDELTEADIVKIPVTSLELWMPKAQPADGEDVYFAELKSVNGDTALKNAVITCNTSWEVSDYNHPQAMYEEMTDSKFQQGKSYQMTLEIYLANGYEFADNCTFTVQSPSGPLTLIEDGRSKTQIYYVDSFSLGAPTELPVLSAYTTELFGYQAGANIDQTTMIFMVNGKELPIPIDYGMAFVIRDANYQMIETGTFSYDQQYYLSIIVAPYNCTIDNLTTDMVSLNGLHPEEVQSSIGGMWQAMFKLPILKQGTTCNGLNHEFIEHMVPATFDTDGKFYQKCDCGVTGDSIAIPKVNTVKLDKTEYTHNGKDQRPSVIVKDSTGKVLTEDQDYSLIKPENSNAVGSYVIKVILQGNYSGLKELSYKINPASTPDPEPTPEPECSHQWKAATCTTAKTCKLCGETSGSKLGHSYSKTYTVDQAATTTKDGSKSKHCTRSGCNAKSSVTTIYKASKVKLSYTSATYSGSTKSPKVTIQNSKGKDIDAANYTLTKPTGRKNAGTYTYTVKFKNEYSGTKTMKLTIKPKKIDKLTLSKTSYVYDGKAKKPTITVKSGTLTPASKITKSNSNVTVTYATGRTKVGTYKVTIKGKGNYTGTLTKTFKINPAVTKITGVTAAKKAFTVKWTKKTKEVTGYQICYGTSTNKDKCKKVLVTKNSKVSKKITKLTSGKKYNVWIRTYKTVGKNKYYSAWSAKKTVKVK